MGTAGVGGRAAGMGQAPAWCGQRGSRATAGCPHSTHPWLPGVCWVRLGGCWYLGEESPRWDLGTLGGRRRGAASLVLLESVRTGNSGSEQAGALSPQLCPRRLPGAIEQPASSTLDSASPDPGWKLCPQVAGFLRCISCEDDGLLDSHLFSQLLPCG